ncbi:MAG: glutaredoxin family protein, partial [gamma proteobacterium symbiont of Stewartia floridana]
MNMKSAKINWILLPILLLSAAVAEAEIFKWTDEHGKVHFTDKPPADADASEVKLKINTIKSVSFDRSIFNFGKKVVIYSTEWCGYCEKAKRYFKRKKIKYTEYDIEKSSRAKRQYKKMG